MLRLLTINLYVNNRTEKTPKLWSKLLLQNVKMQNSKYRNLVKNHTLNINTSCCVSFSFFFFFFFLAKKERIDPIQFSPQSLVSCVLHLAVLDWESHKSFLKIQEYITPVSNSSSVTVAQICPTQVDERDKDGFALLVVHSFHCYSGLKHWPRWLHVQKRGVIRSVSQKIMGPLGWSIWALTERSDQ